MGEAEPYALSHAPPPRWWGGAMVALLGPRSGTMVVWRLPVWVHEVRRPGGACLFGDSNWRRVCGFCLVVMLLTLVRAVRGG
jgi:hypothetical protein